MDYLSTYMLRRSWSNLAMKGKISLKVYIEQGLQAKNTDLITLKDEQYVLTNVGEAFQRLVQNANLGIDVFQIAKDCATFLGSGGSPGEFFKVTGKATEAAEKICKYLEKSPDAVCDIIELHDALVVIDKFNEEDGPSEDLDMIFRRIFQ